MRLLILVAALFLSACSASVQDTGDTGVPLAPLAPVSAGTCPDLSTPGGVVFDVNGVSRTAYVYFPESKPANMPVVFFWHPLGATAAQIGRLIHAQTLADSQEMIFVLPQARPQEPYEWQFYMDDGGNDATFYDDLRTCIVQQLGGDPMRVTSAGMSAGGLWSSWMTLHRSNTLATTLVMSGGTGEVVYYTSPETDLPVLVMWGGASDHFTIGSRTVNFDLQSRQFIDDLVTDGHFVVGCNHNQGHTIPIDGISALPAWLLPHTYGQPSPFADGGLAGLPSYCQVEDQPNLEDAATDTGGT